MDSYYQHLDLQALLDMLAEETEKYTKAFISGDQTETAYYRTKVNIIMTEIYQRKDHFTPQVRIESSLDATSDTASSTI